MALRIMSSANTGCSIKWSIAKGLVWLGYRMVFMDMAVIVLSINELSSEPASTDYGWHGTTIRFEASAFTVEDMQSQNRQGVFHGYTLTMPKMVLHYVLFWGNHVVFKERVLMRLWPIAGPMFIAPGWRMSFDVYGIIRIGMDYRKQPKPMTKEYMTLSAMVAIGYASL
ncbi:hypothetical protein O0I10_006626 [Lichtheimia ornata]|uniref:Uncharacterized protein n=1 Tax=Lichtheimia ornata TaxID=688661 RepID=A0AAD7Y0S1_9FUNG|nr:uncharacterized protein O0I10_006626 [Lichtheimia ornata]KAJ8657562.1 hypothetical protein O0I10_006626 [Lichtheimia ornata]